MSAVGIHAMGLNCSLGNGLSEVWQNILAANQSVLSYDTRMLFGQPTYLGRADVPDVELTPEFNYRVNHLLVSVFQQIESDYQQIIQSVPAHRIGVVLGTSTAGVDGFEQTLRSYQENQQWPSDYVVHQQRMGSVSEFLADYLDLAGPRLSISTACSSGTKALLAAKRWLQQDICDVVIAGGVDVLCQLTVNGFHALGALSDKPCIPFSVNRQGINIGEGAALMVLTKERSDLNILGGGETSDAHHISAPDPSGQGAIRAMQAALKDAGLDSNDIDYINLHGTGTAQNDAMESLAVHQLFGAHTACSSSKALTGHTLGAAGAIEAVLSALSMTKINQQNIYLPHVFDELYDDALKPILLVKPGHEMTRPKTILSNSFAFGGSNAAIILGQ